MLEPPNPSPRGLPRRESPPEPRAHSSRTAPEASTSASPTAAHQAVSAYYDGVAEDYERRQFLTRGDRVMLNEFTLRCRIAGISELFDFGCGTCKVTREFAEQGFSVTACDQSPAMIRIAQSTHAHPRLAIHCESFTGLLNRILPNTPVGVMFLYSLIHLPHDECRELLGTLGTRLALGSQLLIAIHYGDVVMHSSPLNGRGVPIFGWKMREFHQALSDAGFTVCAELTRFHQQWEFPNTKSFLCGARVTSA